MTTVAAADPGVAPRSRTVPRAALDAALAVAALAGALALLAHGGVDSSAGARSLDGVGVALAALASLPLVAWRHAPLAVFALMTLASATSAALGYGIGPPIGPTIGLYLLASSRTEARPWTRRTTLAVAALFAVHVAASGLGHRQAPGLPLAFGVVVWSAAWFAGDRARLRRERIAALEERARRAEREAERERRLAAAEERTRIARDLHDSAGHAINVILVQAGAARLLQERSPAASRAALETIEEVARQTVADIDRMVRTLRDDGAGPPSSAPHGLAALDTLVAHHRLGGLDVAVRARGERRPLAAPVDQAAYRILQEALTNAARHGAGGADVELAYEPGALALAVSNAVRAGGAPDGGGGHGLVGMRERAALAGGELRAGREDRRFVVRARLPCAGSDGA